MEITKLSNIFSFLVLISNVLYYYYYLHFTFTMFMINIMIISYVIYLADELFIFEVS